MTDLIGVTAWYAGDITSELKRAAAFFDKIAIRHLHQQIECEKFSQTPEGKRTRNLMERLFASDIAGIM